MNDVIMMMSVQDEIHEHPRSWNISLHSRCILNRYSVTPSISLRNLCNSNINYLEFLCETNFWYGTLKSKFKAIITTTNSNSTRSRSDRMSPIIMTLSTHPRSWWYAYPYDLSPSHACGATYHLTDLLISAAKV